MREQIEAAFAGLHADMRSDRELQTLVERARDDWTAADRLATEAISVRRAPGDPHGAELMDSFNGLVISSVDKLGAVYGHLATTLRADHDSALRAFERSEWLAGMACRGGRCLACGVPGDCIGSAPVRPGIPHWG
jgi:hypothetical protein